MFENIHTQKPLLFNARKAHSAGAITYQKNGTAVLKTKERIFRIPPERQYDLTQATIFGLNERLTLSATSPILDSQNSLTLRDKFNREWKKYEKELSLAKGHIFNYGVYAYYRENNDLVRYCEPFWHRVVAVASNSLLLSDPENKLTWHDIRGVFENTTIAIAGGSVGSNVAHLSVMDIRPKYLKIADKSNYKMENINRVRVGYRDMVYSNKERKNIVDSLLRNKAEVIAGQLYAIDPFIEVFTYKDGISIETSQRFFDGTKKEPKADIVVEEVDDPKIKIFIREEARKRQLPVIMVSDFGSCVQLDVYRFDFDGMAPLSHAVSDTELHKAMDEVYKNPGNKRCFFNFVDALVGEEYKRDELKKIMEGQCEIPTSTIIPQLGSTASMSGAIAAETIARIRLGFKTPKRVIFDKRNFTVKIF